MLIQNVDRRILSLVVLSAILLFVFFNHYQVTEGLDLLEHAEESKAFGIRPKWAFNTTLHERDYGLSKEECSAAFPGLWANIESVHDRRMRGERITREDVDKSFVKDKAGAELARILIYDRQIYIVEDHFNFHKNRAASILSNIHRAIIGYRGRIPNIEFVLSMTDGPNGDHQWALTREEGLDETTWLVPDQGFWTWPVPLLGEYTEVRKMIMKQEPAWEDKIPKAAWRGVAHMAPIRGALIEASEGKAWSDIRSMSWSGNGGTGGAENKEDALTALDHCKYQYLIYTEGATYSGRFKYLNSCKSVIITHELKWAEWHQALMKPEGPDQNIVLVKRDWSDLNEKMEYLLRNPAQAQRIAENSARTFRDRYMTPAAQACYLRRMIDAWADVQAFEPELWDNKEDINGHMAWRVRGTPYETWMIQPFI